MCEDGELREMINYGTADVSDADDLLPRRRNVNLYKAQVVTVAIF
jgi:hypothetical protein